jgi:hypothetical protein
MQTDIYQVGVNDNKFWGKDLLIMHLYQCMIDQRPVTIDLTPEGSSCDANGLYRHLDTFCDQTGYSKNMITIRTGNMIELHDHYVIKKDSSAWFEVPLIQQWLPNKLLPTYQPNTHFGHFIGKSNWHRLWLGAVLHQRHADKLLQTFNSGIGTHYLVKNHGLPDFVGLEDLVRFECDCLDSVVEFLKHCPKVFEQDINEISQCATYIKQTDYYPIQFPANMNILKYYNDIFVDIVHETFVRDQVCFATEKTWRPIVARRPFIAMAGVGHLQNLKKLGFRTFSEFWDEGYDDCGMQNRVNAIIKLIEQISTYSQQQLNETLIAMQPILDHNYNVFMTLTHQKIQQAFDD